MKEDGNERKQWIPFVVGLAAALGVGFGLFVAIMWAGAESAAEKATGGTTGGMIVLIICFCAIAAARRRRSERK